MSEFVTPMGEAMGAAREMYESALAAGFTDTQAMQLVVALLTTNSQDKK